MNLIILIYAIIVNFFAVFFFIKLLKALPIIDALRKEIDEYKLKVNNFIKGKK
ncbi:MAG: hypothetical protein GY853_09565 [PVC group bacterium]|nr:hypothetical protein [PVC group bacterium]